MAWDKNKPGNSDKIRLSAATIRGNFQAIEDDTLTIPTKGIRLKKQTSDPTPVSDTGFVYTKLVDSVPELFYEGYGASAGPVQITSGGELRTLGAIAYARVNGAGVIQGTAKDLTCAYASNVYTYTLPAGVASGSNYGAFVGIISNGATIFSSIEVISATSFKVRLFGRDGSATNGAHSVLVYEVV
jgi:hypothetical protein